MHAVIMVGTALSKNTGPGAAFSQSCPRVPSALVSGENVDIEQRETAVQLRDGREIQIVENSGYVVDVGSAPRLSRGNVPKNEIQNIPATRDAQRKKQSNETQFLVTPDEKCAHDQRAACGNGQDTHVPSTKETETFCFVFPGGEKFF